MKMAAWKLAMTKDTKRFALNMRIIERYSSLFNYADGDTHNRIEIYDMPTQILKKGSEFFSLKFSYFFIY